MQGKICSSTDSEYITCSLVDHIAGPYSAWLISGHDWLVMVVLQQNWYREIGQAAWFIISEVNHSTVFHAASSR